MLINLLRKEMFTQKAYVYILGLIWFIPFTNFFTSGDPIRHIQLLIVLALWIPYNAAYYELAALVNSLPVTRRKVVMAKYASGLIWFIPAAVIVIAYVLLFDQFAPFPTRLMTGWDLLLAFGSLCFILSVFYPLLMITGYITSLVLTVVFTVVVSIGIQMVGNIYNNPSLTYLDGFVETVLANQGLFILLFALAGLIVIWLSYHLSVRFYHKKDF